jgi:hypothetical protein
VFRPVEASDMSADEMGDTFVDERFESRWASRSIRK